MEFYYRATPTKSSESIRDAFGRVTKKYGAKAGELFPQARSVDALVPLREVCTNASAFVLDVPLALPASKHWKTVVERVEKRGTEGLAELIVSYGTLEKTTTPWKELGVAISTPIEVAVRSGYDFVSKRAVFEVSIDRSRASARPAFKANEPRIDKFLKQYTEKLFRPLPAGPKPKGNSTGHRWGKPETRGGPAFLTKWIAAHKELDHLTLRVRGTAKSLIHHADLFPSSDHHVMAFIDEAVSVSDALPMFEKKTYGGLLSFTVGLLDNPASLTSLCLKLSKKGLELEVTSLDELEPNAGKALGLRFELSDID